MIRMASLSGGIENITNFHSLTHSQLSNPIKMVHFLATLLLSAVVALAAPSSLVVPCASNEGVYLSNCDEFEPGILYSEMDYYSNAKSGSQDEEQPQATAYVQNGYVTWEGQQVCATFSSSGEQFCSNIESGAGSYATGAFAGTGYNDETDFNCYKDNGRTLYTSTGIICKSIYYCFDA